MGNKWIILAIIIAFQLILTACGTRVVDEEQISPEERIVIKFSHVVAENTPKGRAASRFARLVNQRTGGRVEVQVYPNSTLYKDGEEMNALLENKVQMIAPATAKMTEMFPRWQLFDLPFLFDSYEEVHRVIDSPQGEQLFRMLEEKNMLALAMWDNGFKNMSSRIPLIDVEDFRGLTFRIMPSRVLAAQFRYLGANTIPIRFSEVYAALESGRVDGAENPPSNFYTKGFHHVQPFYTISNHGYLGYAVVVNKEFWTGLPADIRKILEQTMEEVTLWEREIAALENKADLERIKSSGETKVIYLRPQEREEWEKAVKPVYEEFETVIGKDLLEAVQQF